MFIIGRLVNELNNMKAPHLAEYGFSTKEEMSLTLEEFKDFASKNEIEIIEIQTGNENYRPCIKVKQYGISYILRSFDEEKFDLFYFKPVLDLDVLCLLDNKESYLNWIIELWEPFDKVVKPNNCKELLYRSGIEVSRILEKVCVFKQDGKEYCGFVNKEFKKYEVEESYDLLNIEVKNV